MCHVLMLGKSQLLLGPCHSVSVWHFTSKMEMPPTLQGSGNEITQAQGSAQHLAYGTHPINATATILTMHRGMEGLS
jgi:hypothetical protein